MTALIIALVAAVVGVLVVVLVTQRRRVLGDPRRASGASELQRAQLELRWARQLSALSETLDLDELLSRVLQGAAQLANGDASAVALWGKGEPPIVKAMNLTSEEALPLLGSWPSESRSRALTVRYRLPGESVAVNAVQLGLLLPLSSEPASPTGTLGIFWRRAADEPDEDSLASLEELALAAGRAIENARQFRELHELAVRDPLTGLHNRRYFHETLAHEVKRAHRYDRRLAMLFFDLDDFKGINEEIGHLGGDAVLAEVAQRLRLVVRGADIPCRVGGDEFAVILPESSLEDASLFFGRLQLAIQGQPIGRIPSLQISAGMAELQRDDDATSLFRRVDQALYRAKRAGKGRVMAADEPEESSGIS
ncbi:MAG TPA: GGDEF domain-containing protein [Gaiellaceae bacterium]|jgi:diguanylate cyclase (GGDEF)-like protein